MRREARQRNTNSGFRNIMFWTGGVLLVLVIAFGIIYAMYQNKIEKDSRISTLNYGKLSELVPSVQTNEEGELVSSDIGKTVNEMKNSLNNTANSNEPNALNMASNEKDNFKNNVDNEDINIKSNEIISEHVNVIGAKSNDEKTNEKKELNFKMPVEGPVIKEFAKENLIYSETLKEWITHLGIDIEAEKTSVVKAAEAGTIKSIKNDPRYGLTVVIEHEDDYKTIYSNLLTAEFISEGEKIIQGQTIGTIGATAVFEVADEPHLHFEMIKNGEYLNPNIYLK